jgi:hypothetical protein
MEQTTVLPANRGFLYASAGHSGVGQIPGPPPLGVGGPGCSECEDVGKAKRAGAGQKGDNGAACLGWHRRPLG